jgi:hypothetical protein
MTDDYSIGDIVRVAFGSSPLDAIVQGVEAAEEAEAAIQRQVRPPTDNELAEIEELAQKAAELQDKLKAASGDMPGELKKLRDQLKQKFLDHGLEEVKIPGRPPIELTSSSSRRPTRKAITDLYEEEAAKQLTEEQRRDPKQLKKAKAEGKRKALNLWNSIEPTVTQSIKIPDPVPDQEPESPY